jgi:hypothetical protein
VTYEFSYKSEMNLKYGNNNYNIKMERYMNKLLMVLGIVMVSCSDNDDPQDTSNNCYEAIYVNEILQSDEEVVCGVCENKNFINTPSNPNYNPLFPTSASIIVECSGG